ncbi:MAG: exosortase-associated EpsI family protein [Planctomycetota bacterium]
MPRRFTQRTAVQAAAPMVSAALLAVLIATGQLNPTRPQGTDAYIARVVSSIEGVPYRVGGWTGTDLESAPPQAVELLRPTVILHRLYRLLGQDETVRLVLVHCADVRDMSGHHPPNCYPATGWTVEGEQELALEFYGRPQRVALHRFSRLDDAGVRRDVTIASGFIVPGVPGELLADMKSLTAVAENQRRSLLGAAQAQIIFDRVAGPDEIGRAFETFADSLRPAVDQITEGTP